MTRTERNDQALPTRFRMSLAPDAPQETDRLQALRGDHSRETSIRARYRDNKALLRGLVGPALWTVGVAEADRGFWMLHDPAVAIPSSIRGVNRVPAYVAGIRDLPTGPALAVFPCTEGRSRLYPDHAAGGTYS